MKEASGGRSELTFVDQMGEFFDRMGQPRIAGLLFGHLLICSPPEQTAAQLEEATGASAGSVNSMLRLLQGLGYVERRGEPGSRRLWYRIAPGAFSRAMAERMRLVEVLRRLAEVGLEEVGEEGGRSDRLREMRDFYAFFERQLPALFEEYEKRHEDGE
ncbi:MAG: MarR family transcriptional regulator [Thermoanaerobaculia bacterium]|nr:MarR family transcriptional regulator [Thermoanaerobaculia bacterium]